MGRLCEMSDLVTGRVQSTTIPVVVLRQEDQHQHGLLHLLHVAGVQGEVGGGSDGRQLTGVVVVSEEGWEDHQHPGLSQPLLVPGEGGQVGDGDEGLGDLLLILGVEESHKAPALVGRELPGAVGLEALQSPGELPLSLLQQTLGLGAGLAQLLRAEVHHGVGQAAPAQIPPGGFPAEPGCAGAGQVSAHLRVSRGLLEQEVTTGVQRGQNSGGRVEWRALEGARSSHSQRFLPMKYEKSVSEGQSVQIEFPQSLPH